MSILTEEKYSAASKTFQTCLSPVDQIALSHHKVKTPHHPIWSCINLTPSFTSRNYIRQTNMGGNQAIFIVFVLMGCLMVISVWLANFILYREWFGAWPWKDARPIKYLGSKLRLPWRKKQTMHTDDPSEDATAEPLVFSDAFGHEDSSIRPVAPAVIV